MPASPKTVSSTLISEKCQAFIWIPIQMESRSVLRKQDGRWLRSEGLDSMILTLSTSVDSLRICLSTNDSKTVVSASVQSTKFAFALLRPMMVDGHCRELLLISLLGWIGNDLRAYTFMCSFPYKDGPAQKIASVLRAIIIEPGRNEKKQERNEKDSEVSVSNDIHDISCTSSVESLFRDAVISGPRSVGLQYWGGEFESLMQELKSQWPSEVK